MASASRTLFSSVSHFLFLLLSLSIIMAIQSSHTCPQKSFYFSCSDIHNQEFPIKYFNNTSLRDYYHCGGPCELTCDNASRTTMINCSDDKEEPPHRVLEINATSLTITIAVDDPDEWLYNPCSVYSYLNSTFPLFKSVSLFITGLPGRNQTFFGCSNPKEDEQRDYYHCGQKDPVVYGPFYDHGKPLLSMSGCMKFVMDFSPLEKPAMAPGPSPNDTGNLWKIILYALPSIAISAALIVGLYYRYGKKSSRTNLNVEAFLRAYGSSIPQRYTYSEIKRMTVSFKVKVGQGGFGSVYKGSLIDGRIVAVKLLNKSKGDNGEEFINEVATIGRTNHINIVSLLGFCFQHNKRALVYEFMPNGSLDKFTKARDHIPHGDSKSLTWKTMFEIFLGIARGLEYLHRGCQTRILHFDIKPHNILLDKNFCPKISDFGLAKLYPQDKQSKVTMSEARGTIGYIAPEVFNRGFGQVSHKSDVYSYGMMVLEVIGSRRRANDGAQTSNSDLYFPRLIYKQMDSGEDVDDIVSDEDKEVKRKLILVSLWCIQTAPSSRPSMSRVVQMLEGQLDTAEIPPMPTLSSPPRLNLYPSASCSDSFTISSQGYNNNNITPMP